MAWVNSNRSQRIFFRIFLAIALIAITFLATTPRQFPVIADVNDKLNHVLAFFMLAMLADRAFPEKKFWLIIALPLLGYGILIECIQHFIPCRMFSLFDVTADGVGLMVYRGAVSVLDKLRNTK